MRFVFAFLTSVLLASAPAFAADDMGFYVGAGAGQASLDFEHSEDFDFSGSDTAFKLLGGIRFLKYFGVELEYIDAGEADDSWVGEIEGYEGQARLAVELSGFNASLLGAFPIGDKFDVFAKAGLIFWDADATESVSGDYCDFLLKIGESCSDSHSDDGNDFSWGIGASWYFLENFGARIEYQGFEIEDVDTADLISGNVIWRF